MTQTQEPTPAVTRWQPYPAYKASGVAWLGEIPAHWEVKRLKYAVSMNPETLPEDTRADYLLDYVDISNVDSRGAILGATSYEFKHAPSRARRKVRDGDVILSTVRTYLKAISFIANAPDNLIVSTGFAVLRARPEIWSKFLWRLVQSNLFIETVVAHSAGIGYPAISSSQLASIPIWFPPLSEQQAIAAFLDRETERINTLIASKERLIALLQEQRAAIISRAVTRGLDATVPLKDSGVAWLGEIPVHWEVKKIKYLASILRGRFSHRPRNDPKLYEGQYPFIQTGDVAAANKYLTHYQQTLNEDGFAVSKQFPSGTLVMTIAANIGDLAILQFPACFPDSIVGFVPKPFVNLEYLYYNLKSMKQEMLHTATINTQFNLNIERVGSLFTAHPPLSEQQAIAVYLDQETAKIDALISTIQAGIKKVQEYGAALVSAAVTGKIDVRKAGRHGHFGTQP